MITQKLESQKGIVRKINRLNRKTFQLFEKLYSLRPPVPRVPKGVYYANQ